MTDIQVGVSAFLLEILYKKSCIIIILVLISFMSFVVIIPLHIYSEVEKWDCVSYY